MVGFDAFGLWLAVDCVYFVLVGWLCWKLFALDGLSEEFCLVFGVDLFLWWAVIC